MTTSLSHIKRNKDNLDDCESYTSYCQECKKLTTHREIRPDSGCFECEDHTKQASHR